MENEITKTLLDWERELECTEETILRLNQIINEPSLRLEAIEHVAELDGGF